MKKYILLVLLALNISSLKSELISPKIDIRSIPDLKALIPVRIENRSSTNVIWVILNRTGAARAYCIGDVGSTWDLASRGAISKKNKRDIGRIKINNFKETFIKRSNNIKEVGVRYEGMGAKKTNYRTNYKVYIGTAQHAGKTILRTRQNIYKIGIEIYDNYIITKQYILNEDDAKKAKRTGI